MKFQEENYKKQISTYEADLKKRKAEIAAYDGLLAEKAKLEKELEQAKKRLHYMQTQADQEMNRFIEFFRDMGLDMPELIVLKTFAQAGRGAFKLTGSAFDLEALGAYATRLQDREWCDSAVIDKITAGAGRLEFEMTVNIKG
jgi:Tfp pilus assembly protein PilN